MKLGCFILFILVPRLHCIYVVLEVILVFLGVVVVALEVVLV